MATQNEIQALKQEIEKPSQTVEKLAREKNEEIKKSIEEYISKDLASEIRELKEKIAQKVPVDSIEELKEKMENKLPVIKEEGEQIIENITEFTKKNPLISLGIALGIGVLIGKVLKKWEQQ